MKAKYKLEITDLYGGDGFERIIDKVTGYEVKEDNQRTDQAMQIPISRSTTTITQKKTTEKVKTFDTTKKGIRMRLGGQHGKLSGLLKEAAILLHEFGDKESFPTKAYVKRMMPLIQIEPEFTILDGYKEKDIQMRRIPQELNTIGNVMQFIPYDMIPKSETSVSITFPEQLSRKITKMVKQAEKLYCLNKRRSRIKFVKI